MKLDDIEVPITPVCTAAHEVAMAYCSPALLNHSIRAYLWAATYAGTKAIAFDAELLYVSAMLHDIGLAAEFDSNGVPFEYAGGHLAWVFCAGAGWPVERRERTREIIVRHMWDSVNAAADPEGHLLEVSTGMDISGRNVDALPPMLREQVLDRYPRLGLAEEFIACFREQAERKPTSRAAELVRSGIAQRIATNPLDRRAGNRSPGLD